MSETEQGVTPFALELDEAARYIGMSPRWLEASDVPRARLGRAVRFLREDLESYVRARRTHGGAAA